MDPRISGWESGNKGIMWRLRVMGRCSTVPPYVTPLAKLTLSINVGILLFLLVAPYWLANINQITAGSFVAGLISMALVLWNYTVWGLLSHHVDCVFLRRSVLALLIIAALIAVALTVFVPLYMVLVGLQLTAPAVLYFYRDPARIEIPAPKYN